MSSKFSRLAVMSALATMTTTTLAAQQVVGKFGEAFVGGRRVVVEVLVAVPPG